jgi:hypothetical protein
MYSPELSVSACVAVRRLAWAFEMPMTRAMDELIQMLPSLVDPSNICLSCRDKEKCNVCVFSLHSANPGTLALFAAH